MRSRERGIVRRLTQPERDVRGLHCLIYHCHEPRGHVAQICLGAQCVVESSNRPGDGVLVAVEVPVNRRMDAATKRVE